MTKVNPFRIFKNASANVARGMAAALVALVLPPFLTRSMSPAAYGAWVLILQFSGYISYLDFGIQTAVGRFVAYANERSDRDYRDRIVSTSLVALSVAGVLALIGSFVAALLLPHVFQKMPSDLLEPARIAVLLVAGSLAIGLPFSAFNGVFVGLHRYDIPAITVGGSRILSAVLLIAVVRYGGGLVSMGIAAMTVNLLSYVIQYAAYRRLAPDMSLNSSLVTHAAFRELFDYCFSLSIWSFAVLLVTGVDLILVGFFQYQEVAFYAVAATLVMFLGGLHNAIFSTLLPSAAALHARGSSAGLGRMLITSTRYGAFLLLFTGIPLLVWAPEILRVWVGPLYAAHASTYLRVLVVANMIRLCAAPYSVLLIGTAQQRLATVSPVMEGLTNLVASMIGGYYFGALGIAVGTLVGSIVAVLIHFGRNLKRTTEIQVSTKDLLRDGLMRPAVCLVPILACAAWASTTVGSLLPTLVLVPALLLTIPLTWRCGILENERQWLKSRMLRGSRQ